MAELRFTILGSGSSGGVPRIGGPLGRLRPREPQETAAAAARCWWSATGRMERPSVLIDTPPDMRNQLLDAEVGRLDAVVYTHSHADHLPRC